jgi:hypothetical protein
MFEPSVQNLTIADGQVAATAVQITTGPGNRARPVNVILSNTGTQDETVTLTLSRNGGTARRIWRGVLSANWQARICGLPMNVTDSLLAAATDAAVIDYVVAIAGDNAPLTMAVYDDSGLLATAPQVLDQLSALTG